MNHLLKYFSYLCVMSAVTFAPTPLHSSLVPDEPGSDDSNTLIVLFPGFDCASGNMMVAVYSEFGDFLSDKPFYSTSVTCSELSTNRLKLKLPEGRFAVAVYHDTNGNKRLDRNFANYPTEPFGFSNNPRLITGPPAFDRAAITLSSDMEISILMN